MFCKKCGTKCKDEEKICPNCGSPLKSASPTNGKSLLSADSEVSTSANEARWFQKHKKAALIIIVVIVAVIVIVAICVSRHFLKQADISEEQLESETSYIEDSEYEDFDEELDGKQSNDIFTTEEIPPSVEVAEELLDRIKYNSAEELCYFYKYGDDFLTEYSEINAEEAFSWVSRSVDEIHGTELVWPTGTEGHFYLDGKLYIEDELNSDQKQRAEYYIIFPTAFYEGALKNMFGFDLEDYDLSDMDFIIQDNDGTYYIYEFSYRSDAFALENVTSSIEYISKEPDQDGNYTVIVKYDGETTEREVALKSYETYFMQFYLRPDPNSQYGYVIAGMTPAGKGELDEEFKSLMDK